MFLIGDNILLGLAFYLGVIWVIGAVLCVTIFLTLVYGATYYDRSERTGRRACPTLRHWTGWRWYRRCYRHQVVFASPSAADDDPRDDRGGGGTDRPCIYAATPHGVNALSFILSFMVPSASTVRRFGGDVACGVWPFMFWLPGLREIALSLGAISIERDVLLKTLLSRKQSVALLPEGTREIAPPANFKRKARPGFLKLAWEAQGAIDCAYVYCHNEERNYFTCGNEWRWRQWMRDSWIGAAITPYAGAFCLHPLTTFIGPRHVWRPNESYDDYCKRWYVTADTLRQEWIDSLRKDT